MSLVDWQTGLGNARFWTMKMLIDGLGHEDKHVLDTNVTPASVGDGVYARGFAPASGKLWPGPSSRSAVLLANLDQNLSNEVHIDGLRGAILWSVEHGKSGHDSVPYAVATARADTLELAPLAVVLAFLK